MIAGTLPTEQPAPICRQLCIVRIATLRADGIELCTGPLPERLAALGRQTAGDSLYENGIGSVDEALSDGADSVADTGRAIGGLAKDAWDAIV